MSIATEIVSLKTVTGITTDEFTDIVDALEKNFHSKQKGFMDTELIFNAESNEWMMIQHWSSMEELKAASALMFQDENAASFVKALNPESIKMIVCPQTKVWR